MIKTLLAHPAYTCVTSARKSPIGSLSLSLFVSLSFSVSLYIYAGSTGSTMDNVDTLSMTANEVETSLKEFATAPKAALASSPGLTSDERRSEYRRASGKEDPPGEPTLLSLLGAPSESPSTVAAAKPAPPPPVAEEEGIEDSGFTHCG